MTPGDAGAHLSDREPPWTALLEGMQQLIGGDSGELLNFQQHDVSPAAERVYTEHFFAHDTVAPLTIGAAPGSGFDTQELFSSSLLWKEAITPAEARVLTALMAGQSSEQHAVVQGVSVHTVRSQVTSLMTKMECARQVDLVRKALLAP